MRTALCTLDNTIYGVDGFEQVLAFVDKRRSLVCTQCGGPAFYRRHGRDGREACFGGRPHVEGCDLAALEHDGGIAGESDVEDEVFTTGQRIVVDFNFGATATGLEAQPARGPADNGNQREHNLGGITPRNIANRRMSSILRALISSEQFRTSPRVITIVGQDDFISTDFFVNFADVTETHIGRYHGFWGMIPDARESGNTLWFNSGGPDNVSVLLDERFLNDTAQRFQVEGADDIAGAYLLVFGELKRSRRTDKKHVVITDPSRFTLKLAR